MTKIQNDVIHIQTKSRRTAASENAWLQLFEKFFGSHFDFAENLAKQPAADILSVMPRDESRASVRVLEEDVRTRLAFCFESKRAQSAHYFACLQDRETTWTHILDANQLHANKRRFVGESLDASTVLRIGFCFSQTEANRILDSRSEFGKCFCLRMAPRQGGHRGNKKAVFIAFYNGLKLAPRNIGFHGVMIASIA